MKKRYLISSVVLVSFFFFQFSYSFPIINFGKVLGPFPQVGSQEANQDYASLIQYQQTRTSTDCQKAQDYILMTPQKLFLQPFGPLTKEQLDKAKINLLKIFLAIELNVTAAKYYFHRPRPYDHWPELHPCIKESDTYAYPSGHAALSRAYALELASMYPLQKNAMLKIADDVAQSRVTSGVHHPSDIIAGKKLADEIMHEIKIFLP